MAVGTKVYMVKNISTADLDNSNNGGSRSAVLIPGVLRYDLVKYSSDQLSENSEYVFDGTEAWSIEITKEEARLNRWNPLFDSQTIALVDPFFIGQDLRNAGLNNQKLVREYILLTAIGPLFKNGIAWTKLEKLAYTAYWLRVLHFADVGNIGVMRDIIIADQHLLNTGLKTDPSQIGLDDIGLGANISRQGASPLTYHIQFQGAYGNTFNLDMYDAALTASPAEFWNSLFDYIIGLTTEYKMIYPDATV